MITHKNPSLVRFMMRGVGGAVQVSDQIATLAKVLLQISRNERGLVLARRTHSPSSHHIALYAPCCSILIAVLERITPGLRNMCEIKSGLRLRYSYCTMLGLRRPWRTPSMRARMTWNWWSSSCRGRRPRVVTTGCSCCLRFARRTACRCPNPP